MSDRKLVLGLDIGVGSVGWGLIDRESGRIIDKGVRLFSEIDPENNVKRRGFRHIRRSIRRKEFRLYRTRKILLEMGLIDSIDFMPLDNPYEIRRKGIYGKLNKEELATAILHLMKRNGFRYDVADDEESGTKAISEEYLCLRQLKKFEENGKIRGIDNKYHFSLYEKEFLKLLEVQKVPEEYAKKLIDIFSKRRNYEDGPGSEKSPSIYGRFLTFGAEPINLINKMRGHCSIFPDELRAPKICPSSELFNVLNDLNNLTVHNNHISQEKKAEIIEYYFLEKGKITIKQLESMLGVSLQNIDGFRINAKGDPIISEMKSIQKIKDLDKKGLLKDFEINSFDDLFKLDKVFEILTQEKSIESRIEELKKHDDESIRKNAEAFASIKGIIGYHSLSLKALKTLIDEMLVTSKNSQQIIVTFEKSLSDSKELKIPDDAIMSPVVKKSVNQTFKVLKAVIKQYGKLDTVMIEMTREKNSKDEQKKINDALKKNLENKERILEQLNGKVEEPSKDLIEKVGYYLEQDGKSPYSNKNIDLNELIKYPQNFEIDHIIPYSISLNDSKANKVLVYSIENQKKGQRTPYQAMSVAGNGLLDFKTFEGYVRSNNNFSHAKKENLLFLKDINSSEVREEFINRNLSDTRYITKLTLNYLKSFFASNDIDTKVHVINGNLTHRIRIMCDLHKNRSFYSHHAVDALLIASVLKSRYLEKALTDKLVDEETGEVYLDAGYKDILGPVAESVTSQIKAFDPVKDYKFSVKVDKKSNRSLSDQTLYSARLIDGEYKVIKKYKNIYDKDGETVAELIRNNKADNLLIVKNDPKTFVLLQKIVASYPNEKNPFAAYSKEHGMIKKVSGSGKIPPTITSLKYIEARLGTHLDLSDKYPKSKTVKRVSKCFKLQLSPYRMDLYRSEKFGYKFLTVRYIDVRQRKNFSYIDEWWYKKQKEKYAIDETFSFVNSFYHGDLIEKTMINGDCSLEVFVAVNNPKTSTIETNAYGGDNIALFGKNRNTQAIGKKIARIRKLSTDILGNVYEVKNEGLKLKW